MQWIILWIGFPILCVGVIWLCQILGREVPSLWGDP